MHELDEQLERFPCAAEPFSVRLLAAHDHDPPAAVFSVHGEIDLATAPALREALQWVIERQTGPVVVDLCDVGFMDSTGVHVLVDASSELRLQHRRLAIACHEDGQIRRVLTFLGLLDVLTLYPTRASALVGGEHRPRLIP